MVFFGLALVPHWPNWSPWNGPWPMPRDEPDVNSTFLRQVWFLIFCTCFCHFCWFYLTFAAVCISPGTVWFWFISTCFLLHLFVPCPAILIRVAHFYFLDSMSLYSYEYGWIWQCLAGDSGWTCLDLCHGLCEYSRLFGTLGIGGKCCSDHLRRFCTAYKIVSTPTHMGQCCYLVLFGVLVDAGDGLAISRLSITTTAGTHISRRWLLVCLDILYDCGTGRYDVLFAGGWLYAIVFTSDCF